MATLNFAHREITVKIVYFGAPSAGTSTNIRTLYDILPVKEKGDLHQFGPDDESEKIWYFSYVPAGGRNVRGFSLRFHMYAVPGAITHVGHRRAVLHGTDAVVFVADARREREQVNIDSLMDLEVLLKEEGLEMAGLPMVIQVNRLDDSAARAPEEVVFDLNPYGFPVIEAVARDSKGVLEAHEQVAGVTMARVRDNLAGREATISLTAVHQDRRQRESEVIAAHMMAVATAEHSRLQRQATDDAWVDLPTAGEIELAFQPADFEGTTPLQVLGAAITGEDVRLDLIMEQRSTGTPRRLQITLVNRPTASPALARHATPSVTPVDTRTGSVMDHIPDRIELQTNPQTSDFPPVWYGLAGLASGVVIGLLIGVLSFY